MHVVLSSIGNAISGTGTRIFWLSSLPHPFVGEVAKCPPEGYRFPHMLEKYNQASLEALESEELRRYRISYINLYDVVKHLEDVVDDSSHYYRGVPTEAAMQRNVFDCLGY